MNIGKNIVFTSSKLPVLHIMMQPKATFILFTLIKIVIFIITFLSVNKTGNHI